MSRVRKTKYTHPYFLIVEFYAGHPMGLKSKKDTQTFRYLSEEKQLSDKSCFELQGVQILKIGQDEVKS